MGVMGANGSLLPPFLSLGAIVKGTAVVNARSEVTGLKSNSEDAQKAKKKEKSVCFVPLTVTRSFFFFFYLQLQVPGRTCADGCVYNHNTIALSWSA